MKREDKKAVWTVYNAKGDLVFAALNVDDYVKKAKGLTKQNAGFWSNNQSKKEAKRIESEKLG